jgi:hypothetical protein
MEPDYAVLVLESELLGSTSIEQRRLPQFEEAVIAAAATQQGYSGLAWNGGAKLLELGRAFGYDVDGYFATFGWHALSNGIRAALQDKQLLSALSYVTVPFVPLPRIPNVFDQPQVVEALRAGFAVTPRPFIEPAKLGASAPAIRDQFGELLRRLPALSVDSELVLQWSASALQVLPVESGCHQLAAISLLQTLCRERRVAAAYYAFRALAEQHESLWEHPVALEAVRSLIERSWPADGFGALVLTQLCTDEDVLRRCDQQLDLLVVLGALAVNLCRGHTDHPAETTAWHFVNAMLNNSPQVAHALQEYVVSGVLPTLPHSIGAGLRALTQELEQAVAAVQYEMRPRAYAQLALASKIYQTNIQTVLAPFLAEIQAEHYSASLLTRIQKVDPAALISDCEWQRKAPYPIQGKMLRKMVADNHRILQALETAARKRMGLEAATKEWSEQRSEEFELFLEFGALWDDLGSTARWALETLIPDWAERLRAGARIAAKELEVKHHAGG